MEKAEEITPSGPDDFVKVVGSRSHMNEDTLQYIEKLKKEYGKEIQVVSKGSSLNFCLVAEGDAHVYPRFVPTREWDTAAGQAICEAVGLNCVSRETGRAMTYNRENLLDAHFFVRPLMIDSYRDNRNSGSIILIYENTNDTVAARMKCNQKIRAIGSNL